MFLILTHKKVVIATSDNVMYARNEKGKLVSCPESKKEFVFIPSINVCYDSTCSFVEVPDNRLPQDFTENRYLYVNGQFTINPEYVVPDDLKNQIIDEYTLQLIEEGVI